MDLSSYRFGADFTLTVGSGLFADRRDLCAVTRVLKTGVMALPVPSPPKLAKRLEAGIVREVDGFFGQ
jgi:hypothetical protein